MDGVDSSPFMVEVAREVFAALVRHAGCSRVHATFESIPWDRVAVAHGTPTAIVGGYLLDHSDGTYADEIAQRLVALADTLSATSIFLSTAAGKASQLQQFGRRWSATNGTRRTTTPSRRPRSPGPRLASATRFA